MEIWSVLFIPDQDPDLICYPSRIPGSKRHRIPDPQHCYTNLTARVCRHGVPRGEGGGPEESHSGHAGQVRGPRRLGWALLRNIYRRRLQIRISLDLLPISFCLTISKPPDLDPQHSLFELQTVIKPSFFIYQVEEVMKVGPVLYLHNQRNFSCKKLKFRLVILLDPARVGYSAQYIRKCCFGFGSARISYELPRGSGSSTVF